MSTRSDHGSDSDFYGHPETVARLKRRVRFSETDASQPPKPLAHHRPTVATPPPKQQLHNPYSGISYAWQLGESIDDFIRRIPPSTTTADERTPWIYICNPYIRRKRKAESESQLFPGCCDEGTDAEEGVHTALFVEGARERLDLLASFLRGLSGMGAPPSATSHDADLARQAAAKDLLGLAGHLGVTCGKWMLFVGAEKVNSIWEIVARATSRAELGIAAKVSPRNQAANTQGKKKKMDHIIYVYTADFRDIADVGRVLRGLETLGLVQRHKRSAIYYKCDAYTYLGIGSTNPWGIRASLLSSSDVFSHMGD